MNEPIQACCPECRANNSEEENVRFFKSEKDAMDWLIRFGDIRPTIYPCPNGYGWHIDHQCGWGTLDEIVKERQREWLAIRPKDWDDDDDIPF